MFTVKVTVHIQHVHTYIRVCMRITLTVVCLEGLGFDYLTAVAAHHQVEVILCRTLAKYGHVCTQEKIEAETAQVKERQIN